MAELEYFQNIKINIIYDIRSEGLMMYSHYLYLLRMEPYGIKGLNQIETLFQ